jgi:putative acetyltransferase
VSRFRLVPFVPAHLPEATDLWVDAWSRAMPAIDFEARRAWFVDRIGALRANGAAVTCAFDVRDGRMVGFVTLESDGHIDQLAVGVHAWGSGAVGVLLDALKRRAARLYLDVNQDNARAVRVYEREGFRRGSPGVNSASGLATGRYEWQRGC